MRRFVTFALLLGFLALNRVASASDGPAHIYVALRAAANAPEAVRNVIAQARDAYLLGSCGPDIMQTTYLLQEYMAWDHPGAVSHSQRSSGKLIKNMLNQAFQIKDDAERTQALSFVLGWLTHYCTDIVIHPLINEFGGSFYESPPAKYQVRHKHLELFECEHVFQKNYGNISDYIVSNRLPIDLLFNSFQITYGISWLHDYWFTLVVDPLPAREPFQMSADNMSQCSAWMVNVHQQAGGEWTNLEGVREKVRPKAFSAALKGTPPSPAEYRQLMEPLVITNVSVTPGNPVGGKKQATLRVEYDVRDLRLHQLFAKAWDERIERVIELVNRYFTDFARDPVFGLYFFAPPDLSLNTGTADGLFAVANECPGNPDIKFLLAKVRLTDETKTDRSPWSAEGEFIPIPFFEDARPAVNVKVGVIEKRSGWNDGVAGRAFFEVLFDPGDADVLTADVHLILANPATRLPYTAKGSTSLVEARQQATITIGTTVAGTLTDEGWYVIKFESFYEKTLPGESTPVTIKRTWFAPKKVRAGMKVSDILAAAREQVGTKGNVAIVSGPSESMPTEFQPPKEEIIRGRATESKESP